MKTNIISQTLVRHILRGVLGMGCIAFSVTSMSAQNQMNEMWGKQSVRKIETSSERGKLFEWGNYAMFVHWGLYSHIGNQWNGKTYYGIGEWIMDKNMADIDKDEYKAIARSFNPIHFDATKIVQLAKAAGMKYIIITSKHHDGFAMFHSKYDKFNIVDATPFKREPMKELADACKKEGLGFGFYYSHNQDWTTPGASGAPKVDANGDSKTFDDYFKNKCLPQVEEITKNYGDMVLIWFDTPGDIPQEYAEKLVETVHRNQPEALVSGRVGYDLGDYQTLGDMEIPLENIDGLWESVDVTNDAWGYSWYDENWKTPKQVLTNLVSTIARGGTYMLNIGPDKLGDVPEAVTKTLVSAGKWINQYPQTIYGTGPSPWKHKLPWGDVVSQGNKLYLIVYEWPNTGKLYIPGLHSPIKKAYILSGGKKKKLRYVKEQNWIVLDIPYKQADNLLSVIELNFEEDKINVDPTLSLDPEFGLQNLSVKFATENQCHVYKSGWMEKFGEWKHEYCVSDLDKGGFLTWKINVKEPGAYRVDVLTRGEGRNIWKIETDEQDCVQNQQRSSSKFTQSPVGWLNFETSGQHAITIRLIEGDKVDLAGISLIPVTF